MYAAGLIRHHEGQQANCGLNESRLAFRRLAAARQSQCNDTAVYVLSGNAEATGALRMKASGKHALMLGGVECRLLRYDVLPKLPQQTDEQRVSHSKSLHPTSVSAR